MIIKKESFNYTFNTNNQTSDRDGSILRKILKYDFTDDQKFFSLNDFFNYLFYESDRFVDLKNDIKDSLNKNIQYHMLHAYGKNGKSTFLKYLSRDLEHEFVSFDFSTLNLEAKNGEANFNDKCINFYYKFFYTHGKKGLLAIKDVLDHLNNHDVPLSNDFGDVESRVQYNGLFLKIRKPLLKKINVFINSGEEYVVNDYIIFFDDYINNNIENDNSYSKQFLTLLILAYIKILSDKNSNRIIFVLDNLDDVISDSIQYVNGSFTPHLDFFMTVIFRYINYDNDKRFTTNPIKNRVHFFYSYRTANYVNAVYGANSSEKERMLISDCRSYLVSSVKDSINILETRCRFYEENCNAHGIEKSNLYQLIRNILDVFSDKHNSDFASDYFMRIWNGNRMAFFNCVLGLSNYDEENNFLNELINLYSRDEVAPYIKRGAFFNHTIRYLKKMSSDSNSITLAEAIDYSLLYFDNSKEFKKCSLFRLFMSFVLNKSRSEKNKIKDTPDVLIRGASFLEFLEELDKIKNGDGENLYSKEEIQKLFRKIFFEEIDSWSYLITIVHDNTYTKEKKTYLSKRNNFDKLIDTFFENKHQPNIDYNRLARARIYANDNGYFLTEKLKRHFEFFNVTNDIQNMPITFNLISKKREEKIKCDIKENYMIEYEFEFERNLFNAVERIDNCTTKTVYSFLNNTFARDPIEYCEVLIFSRKRKFYFDDVISKSITYLELIRQSVLNRQLDIVFEDFMSNGRKNFTLINSSQDQKKILNDFNAIILTAIQQLIRSFNFSLELLKNDYPECISDSMNNTEKGIKTMQDNLDKIINSSFNNRNLKIQSIQ